MYRILQIPLSHQASTSHSLLWRSRLLTISSEDQEIPQLARSASVREPPKQHTQSNVTSVGGLAHQPGQVSQEEKTKNTRDAKRRTVQVEYVAPQSQTTRGAPISGEPGRPTSSHRTPAAQKTAGILDREKPLPSVPVGQEHGTQAGHSNIPYRHNNQGMPRPKSKDVARSISELTSAFAGTQGTYPQSTRPPTSGSMASAAGKLDNRQPPSRGSYGQPVAPAVATTNAQGRLAQPKGGRYNISAPMPLQTSHLPASVHPNQPSPVPTTASQRSSGKGHKRSSTVSSIGEKIFGRTGSIFGGRIQNPSSSRPKVDRRHPPTSMKDTHAPDEPRMSMDSRQSVSYFRKQNDPTGRPRRFSLLPTSWSFKPFSSGKEQTPPVESQMAEVDDFVRPQSKQTHNERRLSTAPAAVSADTDDSNHRRSMSQGTQTYGTYQDEQNVTYPIDDTRNYSAQIDRQFEMLHNSQTRLQNDLQGGHNGPTNKDYHQSAPDIQPSGDQTGQRQANNATYDYPYNNNSHQSMPMGRPDKNNLQKTHRKFADAYEYERSSHHSGSSGAARKVMDFFRRRGRARAGEDR